MKWHCERTAHINSIKLLSISLSFGKWKTPSKRQILVMWECAPRRQGHRLVINFPDNIYSASLTYMENATVENRTLVLWEFMQPIDSIVGTVSTYVLNDNEHCTMFYLGNILYITGGRRWTVIPDEKVIQDEFVDTISNVLTNRFYRWKKYDRMVQPISLFTCQFVVSTIRRRPLDGCNEKIRNFVR